MRAEIQRLHKRFRTTSIYVTHDQVEAMTLADTVVVMRDGRIEQTGRPMDIYLHPVNVFTATFIGSPAMNMLDAAVHRDFIMVGEHRIPLGKALERTVAKLVDGAQSGRSVKLGIRPEFLSDLRSVERGPDSLELKGLEVDLVEPLGFDKDVTVRIGGQLMLARLDMRSSVAEADTVDLVIPSAQIHLFDPETGNNLTSPPSAVSADQHVILEEAAQ
jgi:multiple sugar transport system ATP-binding protein